MSNRAAVDFPFRAERHRVRRDPQLQVDEEVVEHRVVAHHDLLDHLVAALRVQERRGRSRVLRASRLPLVESDELSGCGSGIFYMVAQTSGAKRFRLPKGLKPGEVLAGPAFKPAGDGLYSADMKIGDIFVLSCVRAAGR